MKKIVETLKRILTKREKNDIIICKKMSLRSERTYREEINKEMDVKILANYLIQCFWNTRINGQRIKCTRTKIGKLLTIVQLLYIKQNGQVAFDDAIAEETCGTSIPVLSVYRYPYDIWDISSNELSSDTVFYELNSSINLSDVSKVSDTIPELYDLKDEVSDSIKKLIMDVFVKFGTYDGYEIGKLINTFKGDICSNGVVCEDKVLTWLTNADTTVDNPIISFIHNYTL